MSADSQNYSGGSSEDASSGDKDANSQEDGDENVENSRNHDNSSNVIGRVQLDSQVEDGADQRWTHQSNKMKLSSVRVVRDDEMETTQKKRVVFLNDDLRNAKYPYLPNYVKTTKYTFYSFLPVALLLQFLRVANVYFLIIAILQSVPTISPLNPFTAITPLAFVLFVSLVREAVEDYRRYRSDRKTNTMKFSKIVVKGSLQEIQSKDIKIGDILLINEEDVFPADLVLMKSSGGQNAFIQTSSLDGEKNLKKRNIPVNFEDYVKPPEEKDLPIVGKWVTEPPSADLYNFSGKLVIGQDQFALNINQLLLKGASLKNTEWILGVVVFTGRDTKIMMNSQKSRTKQSNVEKKLNIIIFIILWVQIWICMALAIITAIYDAMIDDDQDVYLGDDASDEMPVFTFFSYFLLLNTMIPISLIVTIEIIKVLQCIFMTWDSEMFSEDDGAGCHVSSTTINEELGQVTYIFSDKTGTLTQNIMEFKALWVETEIYGAIGDQLKRRLSRIESISEIGYGFNSRKLDNILDPDYKINDGTPLVIKSKNGSDYYELKNDKEKAIETIKLLALCHEWMPEMKKVDEVETLFYQGPSPDETTLVDFAQKRGFEFCKSNDSSMTVKYYPQSGLWEEAHDFTEKTYDIHRKMEFNSDRKRMSVLLTDWDDGKYKLYTKGADSIIKERLSKKNKNSDEVLSKIDDFLVRSSVRGLRTLLLGVRILDKKEFNEIMNEISEAEDDIMNRDKLLQQVFDKYEREFTLLGATAVEDRLQDDVPTILEDFRLSGIKVWMLTGDKLETATNIGFSWKLLTDEMIITQAKGAKEAKKIFTPNLVVDNDLMLQDLKKRAVIIDAEALSYLTSHPEYLKNFIIVAKSANAVICSRVSPAQKAEVVRLIKQDDRKNITLAIGDGANDVSMILEADIGIGIYGREGVRAAQASDFAIHKFKFLWQLVLYHGRYNYIRVSELILYFFYKNIIFTVPQLFFAFVWDFSAQTAFDDWYISFYNLFFTALPIIMRALFETDIDYKRFKGEERDAVKAIYPSLYYVGQRSTIFKLRNYFIWVGSGFLTSFAFFMIVHYSCQFGILHENGKNTDMWGASIILFTSIILAVNIRILVTHRLINVINFIAIFGLSIMIFYLYHWISNYATFWTSKTYVTSEEIHKSPIYYLLIFGCAGTMFVIDLFVETIKVQLLESPTNVRAQLNGRKGVNEVIEGRFKDWRMKYEEIFVKEDLVHEGKLKNKRDIRMKKLQERLDEEKRRAKEENMRLEGLKAAEVDDDEEEIKGEV